MKNGECIVKSMKRSTTNTFLWASEEDVSYSVSMKDILCILDEPVFQRRYWSFSEEDMRDTEESFSFWKSYNR